MPNHKFLLRRLAEHEYGDYDNVSRHPDTVRLPDELVLYISDTTEWIPTFLPWDTLDPFRGLAQCAITTITGKGAAVASGVFTAWADLFRNGPPIIQLALSGRHVAHVITPGVDDPRFTIDRDETVSVFRQLAAWCDEVAASDGELYLFHGGV